MYLVVLVTFFSQKSFFERLNLEQLSLTLTPERRSYWFSEKSLWEMFKILAWIEPT